MKRIGITGGIACGKSTVLEIIKGLGYDVLSCDAIAHEIFKSDECQQWLYNYEPHRPTVMSVTPYYTRADVRQWILTNSEFEEAYGKWISPKIREKMLEHPADIVEVPMLYENDMEDLFKYVWCVACAPELQFQRLIDRSKYTLDEAAAMITLQLPLHLKVEKADFTIWTDNNDLETTTKKVKRFLELSA